MYSKTLGPIVRMFVFSMIYFSVVTIPVVHADSQNTAANIKGMSVTGGVQQPGVAQVLTEDFEAPFPAWEFGWLGTNSNLRNFYGVGAGRGNNPDGLWLDDGDGLYGLDTADINFDPIFGAALTSFDVDIAGYVPIRLQVFDISSVLILDVQVVLTGGAFSDPGVYSHYTVSSTNGISRVSFVPTGGNQVEGNTSIDNVVVMNDPTVDHVGGSVTGVTPTKVVCKNVTTGQKVIINDGAKSWDCEVAGLVVNSGDTIKQASTGKAD